MAIPKRLEQDEVCPADRVKGLTCKLNLHSIWARWDICYTNESANAVVFRV